MSLTKQILRPLVGYDDECAGEDERRGEMKRVYHVASEPPSVEG